MESEEKGNTAYNQQKSCATELSEDDISKKLEALLIQAAKEKRHPQVQDDMLFGSTVKEMNDVYEDAPMRVQRFVRHILNPQLLRQPHNRMLILEGPPGTGKSTLMKAVAFKTNSLLDFVSIGEVQGESRNQTGKNLHNRLHETLKWIKKFKCKTIIGIDELNKIMENSEDKHHDTGFTSTVLWNFLDGLRGEPLYFMATMNQTHKLPKPMKSRISPYTVEIQLPESSNKRIAILKKQLLSDYVHLHNECSDSYLLKLLKATEGFSGRDYKGLADEAVGQCVDEHSAVPEKIILRQKHLDEAVRVIMDARKRSKYDRREETDEEQRERHFIQGQHLTLKVQEKQKGQTTIGVPGLLSRTTNGGVNRSDIKDIMEECFSPEQLQLLKELYERDSVLKPNWRESLGLTKRI
jgi:AAA+ superfamily predicted ATPase